MSRILVTGGAGLIGSNLCRRLLSEGHEVIVLDNFITSDGKNIKEFETDKNFTFFKHDITLPFTKIIETKLNKIDIIYHLACPTGVPNLVTMGEEMLKTCSIGTINILEVAKKNNASMVTTSSSEVYGNPLVFPQTEEYTGNVSTLDVRSSYEEGKRFKESLVAFYARKHGVNGKIVRIFNTYGPGASSGETRVITRFLKEARANQNITVEGKGEQTRTFCYVDDLVDALIAIEKHGKKGEAYNAGSDTEVSILELAKLIIVLTDSKSKITFVNRPTHDHNRRKPDLTKIKSLGWRQTIGIYEGLKKTLETKTV